MIFFLCEMAQLANIDMRQFAKRNKPGGISILVVYGKDLIIHISSLNNI